MTGTSIEELPHIVQSADGTDIAVWRSGSGRPLLLVHGTTSDHATFDELVPHLEPHRTVYRFDRRGRGRSGDGSEASYTIDLEFADVLAVLDSIVETGAGPVDVLSHSFGAFVALGALSLHDAAARHDITGVVAYSPGFGAAYPPGSLAEVTALIGSGDPGAALTLIFRNIIGMPDGDIQVLKDSPVWQVRVSSAWSVVRECQADEGFLRDYAGALRKVSTPVLVLSGEVNVEEKKALAQRVADAVPGARLGVLEDEGHAAHHTAPAALTSNSLRFFDELPTGFDDHQRTAKSE